MIVRMAPTDGTTGIRSHHKLPARASPRNEKGEIVCQHSDCEGKDVTFRRPCEYNKHMDRHERPYKCANPACEQNPGFTYSGGLLRHQREVHKMHLSKKPLYCPHSNCVRSSGAGFTRKENLEEHIRRRHSATSPTSQTCASLSPPLELLPPNRKRLRQTSIEEDQLFDAASDATSDSEHVIKRLKLEIARQNQVLYQQAQELDRLRNLLHSLPPTLIYQAVPNLGR